MRIHGKEGGGNVVLQHSVPHFAPNYGGVLGGGTQRRVSPRHQSEQI